MAWITEPQKKAYTADELAELLKSRQITDEERAALIPRAAAQLESRIFMNAGLMIDLAASHNTSSVRNAALHALTMHVTPHITKEMGESDFRGIAYTLVHLYAQNPQHAHTHYPLSNHTLHDFTVAALRTYLNNPKAFAVDERDVLALIVHTDCHKEMRELSLVGAVPFLWKEFQGEGHSHELRDLTAPWSMFGVRGTFDSKTLDVEHIRTASADFATDIAMVALMIPVLLQRDDCDTRIVTLLHLMQIAQKHITQFT